MSRYPWALVVFGLVLGASLVVSSVLVVRGVEYVKTFNNSQIDVTGSSQKVVTSDQVKWTSQFSRSIPANDLRGGYDAMHRDLELVLQQLSGEGFDKDDLVVSPVSQYPVYQECNYQVDPKCERKVVGYDLSQTLSLSSDRVEDVRELALDVRPLIDRGINFSTQSLEYYYTGLADLRVELLGRAIRDAQARAEAIARSTGVRVGSLQSADSGVFQVTQVNSTEVSGYGVYDTSTIAKEVSAVVHARFTLQR